MLKAAQRVRAVVNAAVQPRRQQYASCTMFGTMPLVCPLCQKEIPPNTVHRCEQKQV